MLEISVTDIQFQEVAFPHLTPGGFSHWFSCHGRAHQERCPGLFPEEIYQSVRNIHRSHSSVSFPTVLRCGLATAHLDRLVHGDGLCIEVYVLPGQREQLAAAQPCAHHYHGCKLCPVWSIVYPFLLFGSQGKALFRLSLSFRELHTGKGVIFYYPVINCHVEDFPGDIASDFQRAFRVILAALVLLQRHIYQQALQIHGAKFCYLDVLQICELACVYFTGRVPAGGRFCFLDFEPVVPPISKCIIFRHQVDSLAEPGFGFDDLLL